MTEPLTLRMAEVSVGHVDEFLRLWPGPDAHDPEDELLQGAEVFVREALALPPLVHKAWASVTRRVGSGQIDDYGEAGKRILSVLVATAASLGRALAYAESVAGRTRRPVAGLAELRDSSRQFEEWRQRAMRSWLWPPTAEEWARIKEDMARGEGLELEDAFAEIAGVSREEWLRRVDERKRGHGGQGTP